MFSRAPSSSNLSRLSSNEHKPPVVLSLHCWFPCFLLLPSQIKREACEGNWLLIGSPGQAVRKASSSLLRSYSVIVVVIWAGFEWLAAPLPIYTRLTRQINSLEAHLWQRHFSRTESLSREAIDSMTIFLQFSPLKGNFFSCSLILTILFACSHLQVQRILFLCALHLGSISKGWRFYPHNYPECVHLSSLLLSPIVSAAVLS